MDMSRHGLTTVFGRKHAAPLLRQTCPLARSAANAALAAAGMRVNGGRLQIGMSPGQDSLIWVGYSQMLGFNSENDCFGIFWMDFSGVPIFMDHVDAGKGERLK